MLTWLAIPPMPGWTVNRLLRAWLVVLGVVMAAACSAGGGSPSSDANPSTRLAIETLQGRRVGTLTVDATSRLVCISGVVVRQGVASHIVSSEKRRFPLIVLFEPGAPLAAEGCVDAEIAREVLREMFSTPSEYLVDIHRDEGEVAFFELRRMESKD